MKKLSKLTGKTVKVKKSPKSPLSQPKINKMNKKRTQTQRSPDAQKPASSGSMTPLTGSLDLDPNSDTNSPIPVTIMGKDEDGAPNTKKVGLDPHPSPTILANIIQQKVRFSTDNEVNSDLMETEISIITNQTRNISGIDKLPTSPPTIDTEIMTIEDDDPDDDNVFIADKMADEDTNDFIPTNNAQLLSNVFSPSTSPEPGSVNALLEASAQSDSVHQMSPSPPPPQDSLTPPEQSHARQGPLLQRSSDPETNQNKNTVNTNTNTLTSIQTALPHSKNSIPAVEYRRLLKEESAKTRDLMVSEFAASITPLRNEVYELKQDFHPLKNTVLNLNEKVDKMTNETKNDIKYLHGRQDEIEANVNNIDRNLESSNRANRADIRALSERISQIEDTNIADTIAQQEVNILEKIQNLENKIRSQDELIQTLQNSQIEPDPTPGPSGPPASIPGPEMDKVNKMLNEADNLYFLNTIVLRDFPPPRAGSNFHKALAILGSMNCEHLMNAIIKLSLQSNSLRLTFSSKLQLDRAIEELIFQKSRLPHDHQSKRTMWTRIFPPQYRELVRVAKRQGMQLKSNNSIRSFEVILVNKEVKIKTKKNDGSRETIDLLEPSEDEVPTSGANSSPIGERNSSLAIPPVSRNNDDLSSASLPLPPPPTVFNRQPVIVQSPSLTSQPLAQRSPALTRRAFPQTSTAPSTQSPAQATASNVATGNSHPTTPKTNVNQKERCGVCTLDITQTNSMSPEACVTQTHLYHEQCLRTVYEQSWYGCLLCTSTSGDPKDITCGKCGPEASLLPDNESLRRKIVMARKCGHTHLKHCQEDHRDKYQVPDPNLENYQVLLNSEFPPCVQCVVDGVRSQVAKKPAKTVRFRSGVA